MLFLQTRRGALVDLTGATSIWVMDVKDDEEYKGQFAVSICSDANNVESIVYDGSKEQCERYLSWLTEQLVSYDGKSIVIQNSF